MSSCRHPVPIVLLLVAVVSVLLVGPSAAEAAGLAPGRLGLHVTTAELDEWRTRAVTGPYKSAGDVSQNSPGDWARIAANRQAFVSSPASSRWAGPAASTGCVAGGTSTTDDPKAVHGRNIRDAAFHALVTRDATVRRTVARELLAQSEVAGLDFSDRSRWCLGTIWDLNPGFEIANWLTSLLYTFEYVEIGDLEAGTASLSASEKRAILDWLFAAAEWMNHDNNVALAKNFTDRATKAAPPYTLTSTRTSNPEYAYVPYDGTGKVIGVIAQYYNNRRASLQRFVGLLGLHLVNRADGYRPSGSTGQTPADLVADSHRFAKDYLVYSVYPAGYTGEFMRWRSDLPDLGWAYAVQAAAPVLTYVDTAARAGDASLMEYVTTAGVHNTAGAPTGEAGKSYRWLVDQLLGFQDGSFERYIPGKVGTTAGRIDGVDTATNWDSVHEVAFAPMLRYWQDPYQTSVIERTATGTRPYPTRLAGFGQYTPWSGDWGTLPASLFLFGRTGHLPSPYGTDGVTEEPTTETDPVETDPTLETEPAPVPRGKSGKFKKAEELTAAACPTYLLGDTFADTLTNPHRHAIECLAGLGIAQGTSPTTYSPAARVSRAQMATFLVRLIERSSGPLPPAARSPFTDTSGSPHAANIDRLAEAGLVAGVSPGRFAPDAAVSRAQMATFVMRVGEHLGLEIAATAPDAFPDDDGTVHESAIDAAAGLAIVTGDANGDFRPAQPVRRDQMASFLTRLAGSLVLVGAFPTA